MPPETPAQDPLALTHAQPEGIFAAPGGPPSDPLIERDPLLRSIPGTPRGRVLGGVRLVKKLGQGGMGAVYSGWHTGFDTLVAVKVLPAELVARDHSYVDRFLREARISFTISHQHLVSTKDLGHEHGLLYLVMELVEGHSAQKLLEEKGRLPEGEAVGIIHEATLGLAEAHRANIVHRDVKPDNILVRARDGQAKLADLGLARAKRETQLDATVGGEQLTIQGTALGTPLFMAPEQTLDAHNVGLAADVWSMGASLFALLAGKAPFMARDLMSLLEAIRTEPAPDLAKIRPDVSAKTVALVRRCLEKDPARRPRDAAALALELGKLRAPAPGPLTARLSLTVAEAKTVPLAPPPSQLQSTHVDPQTSALGSQPTLANAGLATPAPVSSGREPTAVPAPAGGLDSRIVLVAGLLSAVGLAGFMGAAVLLFAFTPSLPESSPTPSPSTRAPTPAPPRTPAPSPTLLPPPVAAPTPSPEPSPTPTPTPEPSPSPTPSPSPAAAPSPPGELPVAQLAPEERTWDGHTWRRNKAGHRHSKDRSDCDHSYDPKLPGWRFTLNVPRPTDADLPDWKRADPTVGVYDWEGKTWLLLGHVHDESCVHVLRNSRWYLREPDR